MSRKLSAILVLMLIVPAIAMGWLGLRSVRLERARFENRLRDAALLRLEERDADLRAVAQRVERDLLGVFQTVGRDVTTDFLRGQARANRFVKQLFIVTATGELVYPEPGSDSLTANESRFLARSAATWKSGERFVGDEGEASAGSHGWHTWFLEDGVHFIFWELMSCGTVVGAEVDRYALLAEAIAALPGSPARGDSSRSSVVEHCVMSGPRGEALYQWGGYDPPEGQHAAATLALSPPFSAWQLSAFESPIDSGLITPGGWGMIMVFCSVVIAMAIGVAYIYREHRRAIRESARRVSFVNQVSHELKTPLTNICIYTELLRDMLAPDDRDASRFADIVTAESNRLGRMINNVLAFARQQRNTLRLSRSIGVVDTTVRRVVEHFRPAFDRKNMRILSDLDCGARLRFDRDVVEQVLGNLLGNAEKYAGAGACVTIASSLTGDLVEIVAEDDGPGIPARRREDVFKPFVRLDDRVTEGASGSGIGLSIARDLARLHGGDLVIEASERGARFKMTFRVESVDENKGEAGDEDTRG